MQSAAMRTLAAIFLLAACTISGTLHAVEIIAHRGASADAPENTLAAMKLGWEQGADAIELDLWISKDGKLVVFHDADTKRIGKTNRKVAELTWEEVQALDVGEWKDAKFRGERVPTLESILATVPAGRRAVLEIKCGPEILPEFVKVVRASGRAAKEMCVISFNYECLRQSKKLLPDLEHYFLMGYKKDPKTGAMPQLAPLIARAKEAGFEGLNLNHEWPVTKEFAAEVKAAGLKLLVWTVDDATVAKRWLAAGVEGITTNKPGWLREQLK
jgi:glycerophosphoryl diester phosphodiesterase